MSIDLLLRALRKCEQLPDSDDDRFSILIEDEWRVNQFLYEDRIRHLSILADKLHKKIVERFNHIPLCAICEGLLADEATKALELPSWEDRIKQAEEHGARNMLDYVTRHYAVNKVATYDEVFKYWKDEQK